MVHRLAKEVLQLSVGKIIHLPSDKAHMIGTTRGMHRFALRHCETESLLTGVPRRVDVLAATHVYRDPWPEHGIERVSRVGGPLIIEIQRHTPQGRRLRGRRGTGGSISNRDHPHA